MIPAAQAVRSLLAMKLIGTERKSHVMDLVMDQAIASPQQSSRKTSFGGARHT
jgi:hypothetical protein